MSRIPALSVSHQMNGASRESTFKSTRGTWNNNKFKRGGRLSDRQQGTNRTSFPLKHDRVYQVSDTPRRAEVINDQSSATRAVDGSTNKDQFRRNPGPSRRAEEYFDHPRGAKRPKFSANNDDFYRVSEDDVRRISRETLKEEMEKVLKCLREEMKVFKENLTDEINKDRQKWLDQALKIANETKKKKFHANEEIQDPDLQIRNDSSLINGTTEIQIVGGETDVQRTLSCTKNVGHNCFTAVQNFTTSHLPRGYKNQDIVELIKATADLTVRVDVESTNEQRSELWANTRWNSVFKESRQSESSLKVGTGMLCEVENYTEGHIKAFNKGPCACWKCQQSDTPSKVWGVVKMILSTQVVSDTTEARHTTCRLFYDEINSPKVSLGGWTVDTTNPEKGWMVLKCVTCDVDLLKRLDTIWKHWRFDLWEKVNTKYKDSRDEHKLVFIVSHPHGYRKKISLGTWMKKYNVGDGWIKYTYTAATCPGSSGAYVHLLGYSDWDYRGCIVHSGTTLDGTKCNFSCAGVNVE